YERVFVLFTTLISIGWFLNTLSSPAYFVNLGTGELCWNLMGHIAIALLNAGLGFLLGTFFGGIGVVAAWLFSLTLGSSIIFLSYHIRHKIGLIELVPKSSRMNIAACICGTLSALIIQQKLGFHSNIVGLNKIIFFTLSTIVLIPLWFDPMRKRLVEWIIILKG
ncbi:MAG: hypothetical protein JSW07_05795, partial [bacterium]